MKKVTKAELKELQETIEKVKQLQGSIGSLEIKKAEILKKHNKEAAGLEVLLEQLAEKYGEDVGIDVATGELLKKKDAVNS